VVHQPEDRVDRGFPDLAERHGGERLEVRVALLDDGDERLDRRRPDACKGSHGVAPEVPVLSGMHRPQEGLDCRLADPHQHPGGVPPDVVVTLEHHGEQRLDCRLPARPEFVGCRPAHLHAPLLEVGDQFINPVLISHVVLVLPHPSYVF